MGKTKWISVPLAKWYKTHQAYFRISLSYHFVNVIRSPFVDKLLSYIATDAQQLLLPLQSRLRPLNPLIVVEFW